MTKNAGQRIGRAPRSRRNREAVSRGLPWAIAALILLYAAVWVTGYGWRDEFMSWMRSDQSSPGVRSVDLDSTVVVTFGAPDVQIVRDGVLVSARLWNEGSEYAHSHVVCELVRDGRILDTATKPLDVPAQTAFTFTQRFTIPGARRGTYTVRAKFKPHGLSNATKVRMRPRSSTLAR
jgi:hypothetical protein